MQKCKGLRLNQITEFGGQITEDVEEGNRGDEQRSRRSRALTSLHRVGLALRANLACLSIPLGQHAVLTLPESGGRTRRSRAPT